MESFVLCLLSAYINNEELEQELAALPKVLVTGRRRVFRS